MITLSSTTNVTNWTKIQIGIQDQNGGAIIHFKIKKTTPFRKLMDAYCKKLGLSKQAVRFTFDGRRLQEQDRPDACGVEDGDENWDGNEECG